MGAVAWRGPLLLSLGLLGASCGSDKRDFGEPAGGGAGSGPGSTPEGGSDDSGPTPGGGSGDGEGGAPPSKGEAGSGGADAEALRVTTRSLPGAGLNVPYEVQLVADGGSGEGYVFEATSELPPGLALSEGGLLAGTPTATGTFELAFTVQDSDEASVGVELTLEVTRKRWLVYTSDEQKAKQDLLYAVDLENALLPRTLLSEGVGAGALVESFSFAPDGKHLAYVVNRGISEGYRRDLFIADLSSDAKAGVAVPTQGDVYWPRERAWALDGSELLFGVEISADAHDLFAVGGDDWTSAQRVGEGWSADFIADGLALISTSLGTGFARRQANGFSTPQVLSFSSELRVANAAREQAGFFRETAPCAGQAYFVDFKAGDITAFETTGSYAFSPTLEHIAIGRQSPARVDIHTLSDYTEASPLLSLSMYSACSVAWSKDGSWLAYNTTDYKPRVAHLGGAEPVSFDVTGVEAGTGALPRISSDNRWLGVMMHHLYLSELASGVPTAAAPVNAPLPATQFTSGFDFAPDARSVYFYGEQETDNVTGVYWVDLSGANPASAKKLYMPANGQVQSADWARDSTAVGYRVSESASFPSASPVNLYVSFVQEASPKARKVNGQLSCSSIDNALYCQRVNAFAFQP